MAQRVHVRVAASVLVVATSGFVGAAQHAASARVAATIIVTAKTDDEAKNGDCTLREAIEAADTNKAVDKCAKGTGNDVILVPAGTYSITLRQLNINTQMTIKGSSGTILDGAGKNWILVEGNATMERFTIQHMQGAFRIDRGAKLTLTDSTLRNNGTATAGVGALAGGIYAGPSAVVSLTNVTMNGNFGQWSGGIVNAGTTTATDITISGNASKDLGSGFPEGAGGVFNQGTFTGRNITVTNNKRTQVDGQIGAGGIVGDGGTLQIANTAVSGNKAMGGFIANDCGGLITTLGYVLVKDPINCGFTGSTVKRILGKDAGLGALANNGGTTQTQLPTAKSPLVDAGNPATPGTAIAVCAKVDQRGVTRPRDGNRDKKAVCDIGAVER